jgi:hydrogenase/urease accessory protein HupE
VTRALVLLLVWLVSVLALAPAAAAHEIRPAYLEIREVEPQVYDFFWKTPARGEMRLALNIIQPEDCTNTSEPRSTMVGGAVIDRWRAACAGGIIAKPIEIENLSHTLTDVIVRFEPLEGAAKTLRVRPDDPFVTIPAAQAWTEVAGTYFVLGVEHILLGFDHLLFVLALLLLIPNLHRLLAAVTAFTVAHSLTLAGTTFGWVKLASAPVEATIALSIMFVAVEITRVRAGRTSLTAAMPWVASFAFGLLHGFGFAGALREIGIPDDAAPLALLFFNLGVEAGQLTFIAAVLTIMFAWRRLAPAAINTRLGGYAWRAPVYFIGVTSAYWFVERTVGVLGL